MIKYKKIKDDNGKVYVIRKSKRYPLPVSDKIYTFDIETTSLFKINNKWQRFDYSLDQETYKDIDKAAVCYIWMFGIEDKIYYGRELSDFEKVLKDISSPDCYKIIWVHNLSWEFTFLMNIFYKKYTITGMCAREVKKPIEFKIEELNIIFRCSYMLTNLSLAAAGKEYTNVNKHVGDLDYNKERSPLTKLTRKELGYCSGDIEVLYEVIKAHKEEYKHLARIPLTSTGTVRMALREQVNYWYIKDMQDLVPERKIYMMLWAAFSGGYTHTNILHSNTTMYDAMSEDAASAYPCVLCTMKYPCSKFMKCSFRDYSDKKQREQYAFLLYVRLRNVKSKYYNHYLQDAHCVNKDNKRLLNRNIRDRKTGKIIKKKEATIDNGRIMSCKECFTYITDVDLEIIKKNYECDIEVIECYKAYKDYLDKRVIRFILDLYKNKTTLKGIKEKEVIYKRDKARLNSCFGMSVTNPLKSSAELDPDQMWSIADIHDISYIDKRLDDMKHSFSTLFYYATGVWCCAYQRANLMKVALSSHDIDRDIIYFDTDSIKLINAEKYMDIFTSYNLDMIEKYRNVMERYPDDFTLKDFMPADKHGVLHPIGFWEFDGAYSELKCLGAKKYCYRDKEDGELHITVSGVSKKGAKALDDDIENFRDGFVWDYYQSGKMTHFYREAVKVTDQETGLDYIDESELQPDIEFTDIDGNLYKSSYRWGIVLMPTTYTMGLTDDYEYLIDLFMMMKRRYKRHVN